MPTYTHDPDADLDYGLSWVDWLATGEIITSSSWAPETGDGNLLLHDPTHDDTTTTVWCDEGTDGVDYVLVNHIETDQGRDDDRTITIKVRERGLIGLPNYAGCIWPIDPGCLDDMWDSYDTVVQQRAVTLASATLTRLTAGRVGNCPVVVRPDVSAGLCSAQGYEPYGWGRSFYGDIFLGNRSRRDPREIELPGPIYRVDEVLIDGVANTDYRVFNRRALRYVGEDLDGWPTTQDWNVAFDEPGAFTVTYLNTAPVDGQGAHAAGLLAVEFAKVCGASDSTKVKCKFPSNITSIVRSGVSIEFVAGSFPNGLTGIREVDLYTAQWAIKGRPQATLIDPGAPDHRIVTGGPVIP